MEKGVKDRMEPIIEVRGLKKGFRSRRGRVEAVKGVDFEVSAGEIFGFLGPNGAGKTTTLRMLTTLLPMDAGEVRVAGRDIRREPGKVRREIGFVSQRGGADGLATGRENLLLQGRLYGLGAREVVERTERLLRILDLADIADRRVRTYSGGQRRRLDIALGMVHQPKVLFLDEPSTGLDPQNRAHLWEQIRTLRETGTTVFLTTHYLDEADALCDRLLIMDHGRVVAEGEPESLKRSVQGDSAILAVKGDAQATLRAREVLAGQPYVKESMVEGGRIRIVLEDATEALPGLLRALDQTGIQLNSLNLSTPSLDDVFLHHTGRSLRDGGSNADGGPNVPEGGGGK